MEGKKVLSPHFDFRANLILVDSRTTYLQQALLISNGIKTYIPIGEISRSMYGQAPFVINGMFTYSADKSGVVATVSYNVQGPRLFISSYDREFEVYELPRHLLDAKVSKKLSKHFNVSLAVRNILNSSIRRSFNRNEGWVLDYDNYTYGINFNLGISYKL